MLGMVACGLIVAPAAAAQSSALDPGFGTGGVLLASGGLREDCPAAFAGPIREPQGTIVAIGSAHPGQYIRRWSATGAPQVERQHNCDLRETDLIRRASGGFLTTGSPTGFQSAPVLRVKAFTPDLQLDAGFGSGGTAELDLPTESETGFALAETPDGRVIVGGLARAGGQPRWLLARLLADGRLDPDFGTGGVVLASIPGAVVAGPFDRSGIRDLLVLPDGRLVAVGTAYAEPARQPIAVVARFRPDGALDPDFDGDGVATIGFRGTAPSYARAVALAPRPPDDARLVVAGTALDPDRNPGLAVAQLTLDGQLDLAFGRRGTVVLPGGAPTDIVSATDVVPAPDGDLLVAGSVQQYPFALARYQPDGRLDRSLGGSGVACAAVAGLGEPLADVRAAAEPSGSAVLGSTLLASSDQAEWVLVRFRARSRVPLGCFGAFRSRSRGRVIIHAAFGAPGRLALDITREVNVPGPSDDTRRLRLGRAIFRPRGIGYHTISWGLRLKGKPLPRRHTYHIKPLLLDRRGRVIARPLGYSIPV